MTINDATSSPAADALLTPVGESQAKEAHDLWEQELALDMPLPKVYYSSPLTRALQTCVLTFQGIFDQSGLSARKVVLEASRRLKSSTTVLNIARCE